MTSVDDVVIDLDDMFFAYCILLKRSAAEFWESRPSQILYCIERYREMVGESNGGSPGGVRNITSMKEIEGWGDKL